jgi:integrase
MIGLLAATGMRVGETIALDRDDFDWSNGVVMVRASKFNKTREVLLHSTVIEALAAYARVRDRHVPPPSSPASFVSAKGTPVISRSTVQRVSGGSCSAEMAHHDRSRVRYSCADPNAHRTDDNYVAPNVLH